MGPRSRRQRGRQSPDSSRAPMRWWAVASGILLLQWSAVGQNELMGGQPRGAARRYSGTPRFTVGSRGRRRGDGRGPGQRGHRGRRLAGNGGRQLDGHDVLAPGDDEELPGGDVVRVGQLVGVHQCLHRDRVGGGDQRQRVAATDLVVLRQRRRCGHRRRGGRRGEDRRKRRSSRRIVVPATGGDSDGTEERDHGRQRPVRSHRPRS